MANLWKLGDVGVTYRCQKIREMRYHRGTGRHQQSFLSLDDLICKGHVVRLIDEICEEFCRELECDNVFEKGNKDTGRMPYHPADLLKILVYGYLNGVSSSRKLERESGRNVEVKWLTSGLAPDHKTLADFRRNNGELIIRFFGHLVKRFKEAGLLSGKSIAVDGTKIKAYASQEITMETVNQKLEDIENGVEKYLKQMEVLDTTEDEVEELQKKKVVLEEELERLGYKKKEYEGYKERLEQAGEERVCITDAEAKMMRGRHGKYYGYNVQVAVDTENHFLTSLQTTDNQNDKGLLAPMVEASTQSTDQQPEEALADAGYYKINQLEHLEQQGTQCYVAINKTFKQIEDEKHGLAFTYSETEDCYYCTEGRTLEYSRKKKKEDRTPVRVYKGTECGTCSKREICTTASARSVQRSENQEWIDAYHDKMKSCEGKQKLIKRRSVAEHPFGTMRYAMGQIPVLLRGRNKVQIEMHLYGIGYNLKRYLNIQRMEEGKTAIRQAA
jgi:transposase